MVFKKFIRLLDVLGGEFNFLQQCYVSFSAQQHVQQPLFPLADDQAHAVKCDYIKAVHVLFDSFFKFTASN